MAVSLLAFTLVCLATSRMSRAGVAEDELQKLKGKWNVVEENIRNYDNSKDAARPPMMSIDGGKLTFLDKKGKPDEPTETKPITLSDIDPSSSPARITLHVTSRRGGKEETRALPGVYKLDGDKLEIAIAEEPGQPRPEKLGAGKHVVYWRCERRK